MNPDDLARSRASLEEAIGLDPAYAPAYSALAHALQLSAFMGWTAATQAQPLAKAAARQALEHDGAEPEAHFVLALVAAQFDYDWPAALRHCRLALESGVAPPDVVGVLATVVLLPLGHVGEAMEVLQRARNVDPLSPFPQQHYAFALLAGGCYQAAIEQLEQQVGLHEMFWPNHFFLGGAYLAQGRIREATETLEKAFRLMPAYYGVIGLLAAAHALGGDRARADALLATLTSHSVGQRALGLGLFHMACAEFEQAATHFEQAIDQRQPSVTQLSVWPFGAAFRESPPGRALIRKIHLPTA
jgi:tetratricopeptide (TPR) repeat protein